MKPENAPEEDATPAVAREALPSVQPLPSPGRVVLISRGKDKDPEVALVLRAEGSSVSVVMFQAEPYHAVPIARVEHGDAQTKGSWYWPPRV